MAFWGGQWVVARLMGRVDRVDGCLLMAARYVSVLRCNAPLYNGSGGGL